MKRPQKSQTESQIFARNYTGKTCNKLLQQDSPNAKSAKLYRKLVLEGCPRKSAQNFAAKNFCVVDLTRQTHGPANHRKLKIKKDLSCYFSVIKYS